MNPGSRFLLHVRQTCEFSFKFHLAGRAPNLGGCGGVFDATGYGRTPLGLRFAQPQPPQPGASHPNRAPATRLTHVRQTLNPGSRFWCARLGRVSAQLLTHGGVEGRGVPASLALDGDLGEDVEAEIRAVQVAKR